MGSFMMRIKCVIKKVMKKAEGFGSLYSLLCRSAVSWGKTHMWK